MPSLDKQIRERIGKKGHGWCFTPNAFLDLAGKSTIWVALSRLVQKGMIRRLARGLYDYPELHPKIGLVAPSPDAVAKALAMRDAIRFQASGAYAANLLGLSDHVPAKVVFLTDGPARRVRVGRQEIILKRTTPRNMATAGRVSGTVIQALRFIGQKQITDSQIRQLTAQLPAADKAQLLKDLVYAPGWMHPIIDAIAGGRNA
jgi:predicted transcriptional regulator of viral defense system